MTYHSVNGANAIAPAPLAPIKAPGDNPHDIYGGPYGWITPYIASIAAQNDHIASRLLCLRRAELHYIALCLSLMGDHRNDPDHLAAFARGIDTLTRKTLVMAAARLGNIEIEPALVKMPMHLAGAPWRPPSYLRLARLMNDPTARKTLRHLPSISRRHVIMLGRLPRSYRTLGVLKMIRRPRDLNEVLFAIDIVRRIRTDLNDRQVIASLEKAESQYIREWVMRHYERVPFPPAPVAALVINGVEALRPLACYDDLARGAHEFDNCIRNYLWRVLKGDAYFYRYAPEPGGKGVAIVELRRAPVIGWVVHEALGPTNDAIKATDRATILAAFRAAGIGAAPQAANPDAWFEIE